MRRWVHEIIEWIPLAIVAGCFYLAIFNVLTWSTAGISVVTCLVGWMLLTVLETVVTTWIDTGRPGFRR